MDTALAPPRRSLLVETVPFAILTGTAATVGARFTRRGQSAWYRLLSKPAFQPPRAAFAPVWTTLYGMMSVSAGRVARQPPSPERSAALTLWNAQLAANTTWSWLFFARHRPGSSLVDLGALLLLLGGYTHFARRVDRTAAWLMAPYLAWTGFAGVLNGAILAKNRRRLPLLRRLFRR